MLLAAPTAHTCPVLLNVHRGGCSWRGFILHFCSVDALEIFCEGAEHVFESCSPDVITKLFYKEGDAKLYSFFTLVFVFLSDD